MIGISRFAIRGANRRAHREGLDWLALEERRMLSGGGQAPAPPAAPALVPTMPAIQASPANNSITPLTVPAVDENASFAGPNMLFIVPAPIPAVVINLGPSSAPATNHLHQGLALSEEQPTGLTHVGQGGAGYSRMVIPRHETPRMTISISLIDEVEAHAPNPQAPTVKPPVAPPPAAPEAQAPAQPARPAFIPGPADAVNVVDAVLALPIQASAGSSHQAGDADALVESAPSMGIPGWIGLAATALGGSRVVLTDPARSKTPWSASAGRGFEPRRRFSRARF